MKKLVLLYLLLCCAMILNAQTEISGTVSDDSGLPLIGASIYEKDNPNNGTITDVDGNFALTISEDGEMFVVTYTGFKTQEIPLSDQETYLITMVEDSEILEEVVVIGYGTSSKRNLTDNVASLSSEDIQDVPVSNFQSTMAGKAAGVRITQTNGKVDAGINIRVRGTSSISAGAEPLYVLDGMCHS